MDLRNTIETIPILLQYFVPGCLFLGILIWGLSKKYSAKEFVVMSCIISYILLGVSHTLFRSSNDILNSNSYYYPIVSSGIGMVSSILFSVLGNTSWFHNVSVKLFGKTINHSIWKDSIDFKNGSNIKAYLKNKDYYVYGHFKNLEESSDSWISISAFGIYDKETNDLVGKEEVFHDDEDARFVIRLSDIEWIEIV